MKVLLADSFGTLISGVTTSRSKLLLLWYIMKTYLHSEFNKFVVFDPETGIRNNNVFSRYSGYCLPKDIKWLRLNYRDEPNNCIGFIAELNAKVKGIEDQVHTYNYLVRLV